MWTKLSLIHGLSFTGHYESGELSTDDNHTKAQKADVNATNFSTDSVFNVNQPMVAHSLTNLHMFNGRVDIKKPILEPALARGTGRYCKETEAMTITVVE